MLMLFEKTILKMNVLPSGISALYEKKHINSAIKTWTCFAIHNSIQTFDTFLRTQKSEKYLDSFQIQHHEGEKIKDKICRQLFRNVRMKRIRVVYVIQQELFYKRTFIKIIETNKIISQQSSIFFCIFLLKNYRRYPDLPLLSMN